MRIRRWFCLFVAVLLSLSSAACAANPDTPADEPADPTSAVGLSTLQTDLSVRATYAQTAATENHWILQYIRSGLDDYEADIAVYSKAENRVTGQVSLAAGAWEINPLAGDRFAATDLQTASYTVYAADGTVELTGNLENGPLKYATFSADGEYLLFATLYSETLSLFSVETGAVTPIATVSERLMSLGFHDNAFYWYTDSGKIRFFSPESTQVQTLYTAEKAHWFGLSGSVYADEGVFGVITPTGTLSAVAETVDEVIIATDEYGFYTRSCEINNDRLGVYRPQEGKAYHFEVPQNLVTAQSVDDTVVLLGTVDMETEQAAFYRYDFSAVTPIDTALPAQ